ncbi:MAG: response regulator transcription factor [Gammaproteobacteria bacterium]
MENVYIVDDDPAVRDSLSMLLKSEDYNPTQFSNPQDFLSRVDNGLPAGIIILDLCMPELTGIEVMQELINQGNALPIICITGHGDVPTSVQALKMGAYDFLEKPYDSSYLIERIKDCAKDELGQRHWDINTLRAKEMITKLTPREHEVMEGMVDGFRNKQIAYNMGISIRTVELHRVHVMEKFEAKSLADVLKIAIAADYNYSKL